ncbi:hypothetical protein HYN48_10220 [Flavobacterium magnum]|uniref:Uncharacterized protein n=1 Tax=Flavobacterium magnum TaxID=2162713 RepID=A0A2S0RFJ5_9FLAO|nr:hypothetical protein [Flavobacterium magnum]AWA30434.1 hypothetical protein HYN48_10220 [Flavobacterium magnum]
MKKSILLSAFSLFVSLTFLSCKNNEEKLKDAQKDMIQAQKKLIKAESESMRQYENYRMKVSKRITDNELAIADLKIKAIDGTMSQKEKYNAQVEKLEIKNMELKQTLDAYGSYNADTWDSFKKDVDARAAALEKDFEAINRK